MLIFDKNELGTRLLSVRKRIGLTQSEAAEKAGLSDRTYADIERGTVNMRVETLLKICCAFHITPNDILTKEDSPCFSAEEILVELKTCSLKEQETALKLLSIYVSSLN